MVGEKKSTGAGMVPIDADIPAGGYCFVECAASYGNEILIFCSIPSCHPPGIYSPLQKLGGIGSPMLNLLQDLHRVVYSMEQTAVSCVWFGVFDLFGLGTLVSHSLDIISTEEKITFLFAFESRLIRLWSPPYYFFSASLVASFETNPGIVNPGFETHPGNTGIRFRTRYGTCMLP